MYINTSQKTFVYGTFRWPLRGRLGPGLTRLPRVPITPFSKGDAALEILREFNPSELVGKLYAQGLVSSSNWGQVRPDLVAGTEWYLYFVRVHVHLFFDMQGSGLWEVLHFRNESDDTGLYVAVALRYHPKSIAWVEAQREKKI
jgi:hypothetical protein